MEKPIAVGYLSYRASHRRSKQRRELINPQGGAVNKSEMADKLAGKADVSKAKAVEIIDVIFSTKDGEGIIAIELDAGGKVNITGFGNFSTKHRAARMGRIPATSQPIHIPAKDYAHFSAAKGLKDRVAR
ncbi:MAG: HU family DNA-binding protein [Actinobacteria bacterium]|nr:HU family DNA-binding protein [Actinomycetota bacterium]